MENLERKISKIDIKDYKQISNIHYSDPMYKEIVIGITAPGNQQFQFRN